MSYSLGLVFWVIGGDQIDVFESPPSTLGPCPVQAHSVLSHSTLSPRRLMLYGHVLHGVKII